jgi:hypothetical protein
MSRRNRRETMGEEARGGRLDEMRATGDGLWLGSLSKGGSLPASPDSSGPSSVSTVHHQLGDLAHPPIRAPACLCCHNRVCGTTPRSHEPSVWAPRGPASLPPRRY